MLEEIVDCRRFDVKRTACRVFEVTTTTGADYRADIYSLKSYMTAETIYSTYPSWSLNKATFDFNQIAPEDISNIYIINLVNPNDKTDTNYIVVYDLCKAIECKEKLLLSILCEDCESCSPNKAEEYRR